MTNCIKAKIDNTLNNIKCNFCGEWNETVNHIISEGSKLAQKEAQDQVWLSGEKWSTENCARGLKFNHADKRYMKKKTYVLKNETH